jgi:hypothetical protein
MARGLAWWPMVFQDVLRLNLERMQRTEFERFAEHHRSEDAGHDRWYLDDLRLFGAEPPVVDELFGDEFAEIREACYSLVAEVLREQSSVQRVGILLALESTGHVFFEPAAGAAERICPELPLRYFGRSHLLVEKDHDLFSGGTEADLDRAVLTDDERVSSEEAIARIYRAFDSLFSALAERMQNAARTSSYIRTLGNADTEVSRDDAPARDARDATGS